MRDPTLILLDGQVRTFDPAKPRARAIAFGGGRILSVGTNQQAERLAGRSTEIIDLAGKVLVPGFVDAHAHLMESASRVSNLQLSRCRSLDDAVNVLRSAVARTQPGEWIVADDWDESHWPEPRYLTRDDLDRASSTAPIAAIRVDRHMASVNSPALELLAIPRETRGFEIDAAGRPTGVLKEDAFGRIWDVVWPSAERLAASFAKVAAHALSVGITSVHDIVSETELLAYQLARSRGHLPLRVYALARHPLLPHLESAGLSQGFGDDWLRLGAIKVFSDGSLGAHTAALLEPYADEPKGTGLLIHGSRELSTLIARTDGARFQAAVHAIGDRAIASVLDAMDAAIRDGRRARHRIEHAELLLPEHIERMRTHGVVASCQPNFVGKWSSPGGMYERRLGRDRLRRNNPYREIIRKRVALAFGSDGMPYGPVYGIHSAVNAPFEAQRITVDEAFSAYTRGGAFAGFDEGNKGTLSAGKLGDAVVLEGDPWRDPRWIHEIRVAMTIVDGRIAYRRRHKS